MERRTASRAGDGRRRSPPPPFKDGRSDRTRTASSARLSDRPACILDRPQRSACRHVPKRSGHRFTEGPFSVPDVAPYGVQYVVCDRASRPLGVPVFVRARGRVPTAPDRHVCGGFSRTTGRGNHRRDVSLFLCSSLPGCGFSEAFAKAQLGLPRFEPRFQMLRLFLCPSGCAGHVLGPTS